MEAALAEVLPLVSRSMAPLDLWDPDLWILFDCFSSPDLWASWLAGAMTNFFEILGVTRQYYEAFKISSPHMKLDLFTNIEHMDSATKPTLVETSRQ